MNEFITMTKIKNDLGIRIIHWKERNIAADTVHTWRQGCARAMWLVDLRTGPRSRLTNPTCLNIKLKKKNYKKKIESKKSHCVIPQTASRVVLTTPKSRGSPPPPSHCPGPCYPGAPHWDRKEPDRSRSRAVAPTGSAARGPRAQKSLGATRASWGQRWIPPCPWPCHSFGRPNAGWQLASAWRRCTLPPPHGQSSLLSTEKRGLLIEGNIS